MSEFDNRMLELRAKYEDKLPNEQFVVVMIDGRGFSHYIKYKYERPFSDKFIDIMNHTAISVFKDFATCVFAYAQSDEITFVLKPTDNPIFNNRLSKLSSLIPSCATGAFNQRELEYDIDSVISDLTLISMDTDNHLLCLDPVKSEFNKIKERKPQQFDCKIFSCDIIDVYSFILWRQLDCIKNSKQQTAQTYLSHKTLLNKTCDEQIAILKKQTDIDWNSFDDCLKYGRFLYKEKLLFKSETYGEYMRNVCVVHPGFPINENEGRGKFFSLIEKLSKKDD